MIQTYLQHLQAEHERYQTAIEGLLERYEVQPVGNGYIDLIVARSRASRLIEELAQLPVIVTALSWWCLVTAESQAKWGCTHGCGGPLNKFGEGRFSECNHYPDFEIVNHGIALDDKSIATEHIAQKCSKILSDYIEHRLLQESFFSECLQPGLWLYVPDDWRRQRYLV